MRASATLDFEKLKMPNTLLILLVFVAALLTQGERSGPLPDDTIRQTLFANIDGVRMRDHLRVISRTVHPAGTTPNKRVAQYLRQQYAAAGLHVRTHDYQVLLSYPDYDRPNTVLLRHDQVSMQLSTGLGDTRDAPPEALAQLNSSWARHWWNGYARNGTATGQMVYCNYGTVQDFDYLAKHNVSVKDKLALIRYGHLFRGRKVLEATRHGAAGVIIYSDPADYGPPSDEQAWPHTNHLPAGAAQRGTLLNVNGDPMTAFYPAFEYAPRLTSVEQLRQQEVLPQVPVTPIGYRDALKVNRVEISG